MVIRICLSGVCLSAHDAAPAAGKTARAAHTLLVDDNVRRVRLPAHVLYKGILARCGIGRLMGRLCAMARSAVAGV